MIKAIETVYNGYRFRSRLEARWAVFFDTLGIEYQYEVEGFDLGEAGWYLPDFWLPTFEHGMYCEVKFTGGDFSKAYAFCLQSGLHIWLCEGPPDYKRQWIVSRDKSCEGGNETFLVHTWDGVPNANQAQGENRMYAMPSEDDMEYLQQEDHYVEAVTAARQARFEKGVR